MTSLYRTLAVTLVVTAGCGGTQPEPKVVSPQPTPAEAPPEDAELSAAIGNILGSDSQTPASPAPSNGAVPGSAAQVQPVGHDTSVQQGAWRPGQFIMQSLVRLTAVTMAAQQQYHVGFTDDGSSIFGAYLEPKTPAIVTREFSAGMTYVLMGATDDDAYDLDIVVKDSSGAIVAQDVAEDAAPAVVFQPSSTGQYRVELYSQGAAFASMALMKKDGGFSVPMERVAESVHGSVQKAETLHRALLSKSQNTLGLSFLRGGGNWCLLGTVLNQGEGISQWLSLNGPHVFLASADQGGTDIDLTLFDGAGAKIAEDAQQDAVPFFSHRVDAGTYRVSLTVPQASSPTLATMVALTVEGSQ